METPDTIIEKRGQAGGRTRFSTFSRACLQSVLWLFVVGCSVEKSAGGFSSPERKGGTNSGTEVQITEVPQQRSGSDVEIIFEPPEGSADGVIVKYGARADNLNFSQRFPKDSWVKVAASSPGLSSEIAKFRCLIRDIPLGQSLFISLAAYSGDQISAYTDPIEIK